MIILDKALMILVGSLILIPAGLYIMVGVTFLFWEIPLIYPMLIILFGIFEHNVTNLVRTIIQVLYACVFC